MPQAFANVPRVGWGKVQSHPSWDSLSYSLITTFQYYFISGASLVAQLIKNPPAIWKTWVRSLGSEDPLEKGKATHSSILAWRIPWTIQSMGLQRVGHDWVTFTFTLSLSQVSSVTQSCPTLCDPMNCSTPGLPVHHQLPEITQTHAILWCHPTISSPVVPFSYLQSFPASGSFQMSHLFKSGGQSIGVSASTSGLPMNTQGWWWTGWIFFQSKELSRVFSNTTVQKHQFFSAQLSL